MENTQGSSFKNDDCTNMLINDEAITQEKEEAVAHIPAKPKNSSNIEDKINPTLKKEIVDATDNGKMTIDYPEIAVDATLQENLDSNKTKLDTKNTEETTSFRNSGSVASEVTEKKNHHKLISLPSQQSNHIVDLDFLARCQHHAADVSEVKSFSIALLELMFEKQADISSAAVSTLQKLARKHPATVLRTLLTFISSEDKSSTRIRTLLFTTAESAINPAIEMGCLDVDLSTEIIKLTLEELLSHAEPILDIQIPAVNILVSIGAVYCRDVVQMLMARLQIGSLPHPSILATFASLATTNIYGTVPYLKETFELLLSHIKAGHVKNSKTRTVFATALAKFSEALAFYFANKERAPHSSINLDAFHEILGQAFEIVSSQWLPCKSQIACQEILEALGQMSQLLLKERLDLVAPKLTPLLLQAYRGPVEPLYVSKALALFLDAFFRAHLQLTESNILEMLQSLFLQVTIHPDYNQPSTIKNHYEVLRCLERIARVHPDIVLNFLLNKMEQPNEKFRIASLTVIKHLINSLKEYIEPFVASIGAQLKPLTHTDSVPNQSNNLKKALIQVIVALAVQGHLLTPDMVHSGRHVHLIAFLLKQCTLTSETTPSSPTALENLIHPLQRSPSGNQSTSPVVTNEELKQMCENVVHLLVTSQEAMEDLFWSILIRFSLDVEYARAYGVIVRGLSYLVKKKSLESFSNVNISGPVNTAAVIARFLVLARCIDSTEKCLTVIDFLEDYGCIVHPSLGRLWKTEIPILKSKLTYHTSDDSGWQTSLETLVDLTLEQMKVSALDWANEFNEALFEQLRFYETSPKMRGFVLTLIGICVYHGTVKASPSYAIDVIVNNVRHQEIYESIGCATALGWCSRAHLDVVLLKLQNIERNDFGRKSTGFLSFMKESRSESEADFLKCTSARCYTRIAAESPPREFITKLEKQIIKSISTILHSSKHPSVRKEGLKAIASTTQSLIQRMDEKFSLNGRADLLKESLVQLKHVTVSSNVPQKDTVGDLTVLIENSLLVKEALNAITALVQIQPVLCADDQSTLVEAGLEKGIPLYALLNRFSHGDAFHVEASSAAVNLLESMEKLTVQVLRLSLDPGTMDLLFTQLLPWTKGQDGPMRTGALTLLKLALSTLTREVEFQPGAPTRFSQGHLMIANILPRCTDPEESVRDLALDCIGLLLQIISMYVGYSSEYERTTVEKLQSIKNDLGMSELSSSLALLASILDFKTSPSDLWCLLDSMTQGLTDPFPSSSSGVAMVLSLLLKSRGSEIQLRNKDLLDILLTRLKNVENISTRQSILHAICILTTYQREAVIQTLLSHSLPYDENISDCWKALASDSSQSAEVLDSLLELLTLASPYEERGPHVSETIISCRLLCAIEAMKSMCLVQELRSTLLIRFADIFCSLLLAQGCCLGVSPPIRFPSSNGESNTSFAPVNREAYKLNPYLMAVDSLRAFLTCANLTVLAEPLLEHRHMTNSGDALAFSELVTSLTALSSLHVPNYLPNMVSFLSSYMKSNLERHRLVSVSFYAELIRHKTDPRDIENIIRGLTMALPDSSAIIRRKVLEGLGALSTCEIRKWSSLVPLVLNSMMDGLEDVGWDKQSDVKISTANEALNGLIKLLPVISTPEIERLAPRLALRVRPFFEHEINAVREAAFSLLAKVFQAGSSTSAREQLSEQVHATFTSLLLHLNESDSLVVRACKSALRHSGPLFVYVDDEGNLQTSALNAMLQTHLPDEGRLNYHAFLVDLVKLITKDYEECINSSYLPAASSYFKSSVPELRANAALYVGLLCGASQAKCNEHSLKNISVSLIRLLHDPVKAVRLQAMDAIALMLG